MANRNDYYYVVSASNRVGEGPDSAQVQAAPAAADASQVQLALQYRSADTADNDRQIQPQFNIRNTGKTPVSLSDLKLRYYFTAEGTGTVEAKIDWAQFGIENVQASVVQHAGSDKSAYVEVGFLEAAGTIRPDTTAGNIQLRIVHSDGSAFDKTNDYSFDPAKTSYTEWDKITLYLNGELVWGIEPEASKPWPSE